MKITRVETIPVEVPLKEGLTTKTAGGEHVVSPYVIIRIHTDSEHIGLGEATLSPRWSGETSPGCVAAIDLNSLLIPFPGLPYALTNGNTTIPTPVPNDPALQGLTVYCQFAAEDVGAPQLFLGISNGLAVHIE